MVGVEIGGFAAVVAGTVVVALRKKVEVSFCKRPYRYLTAAFPGDNLVVVAGALDGQTC